MTLQKRAIFIMGVSEQFLILCRIQLKFRVWLNKQEANVASNRSPGFRGTKSHLSHIPSSRRTMSGHRRISATSEHRRKKLERSVGDRRSGLPQAPGRSPDGARPTCVYKLEICHRQPVCHRRTSYDDRSIVVRR